MSAARYFMPQIHSPGEQQEIEAFLDKTPEWMKKIMVLLKSPSNAVD